jgi:hypothetical protein
MFRKVSWMNASNIGKARKVLREVALNEFGYYNQAQIDGANEGLACLFKADAGYLTNLIPQDHPDRIMAMRLLTE